MRAPRSIALIALWGIVAVVRSQDPNSKDFIGWLGETYHEGIDQADPPRMEVLSWEPRIFLFHHFLSNAECDKLIEGARPRVERSGVANAETGMSELSNIRTSKGMFFSRGENALIKRVEERLARWTMLPAENGEGIQVLQYGLTQKYDPHHDYFSFEGGEDNGGNRIATVLMYLSDVEQGGETVFPKVPPPPEQVADTSLSECARKGMSVRARRGSAVLFWSVKPSGMFDPKSLHGSCPVIKGEKWSATKWIHVGRYAVSGETQVKVTRHLYVPPTPPLPQGCTDSHKMCSHWAESGECEENPVYMVGVPGKPGACIRSCLRCDLMLPATSA